MKCAKCEGWPTPVHDRTCEYAVAGRDYPAARVINPQPIQGVAADPVKSNNWMRQATSAAQMHDTIIAEALYRSLPPGAKIVSHIHDEVLLDYSQVDEDVLKRTLKDVINAIGPLPDYGDIPVTTSLDEKFTGELTDRDKETIMAFMYGSRPTTEEK